MACKFARSEGFTFIEMLAVVIVIGMALGIMMPRFRMRRASVEWPQILSHFNNLAMLTQQTAMRTGRVCRLAIKSQKEGGGNVFVECAEAPVASEVDRSSKTSRREQLPRYVAVSDPLISCDYELPHQVVVSGIYTPNVDDSESKGARHCFVMPSGMAQPVVLHLSRIKDEEEEDLISLIMNPFLGTFEMRKGFVPFPKERGKK